MTWQSDPDLQRLLAAARQAPPQASKGAWQTSPANAASAAAHKALADYIDQHRDALGIPAGQYVSPTSGQPYTPEGTPWWKFAAQFGGGLAGGLGISALVNGAAALPAALPSAIPSTAVSAAAPGVAAGSTAGGNVGLWGSIGKFLTGNAGSQLIQTGGQLAGSLVNANAAGKATDATAAAAREALDFEKGVYDRDVKDFAPYQAAGDAAIGRVSDLAAAPRQSMSAGDIYGSGNVRSMPSPMSISALAGSPRQPGMGGGQMVTLQAPDGTTQQVSESQAEHYVRLGARRMA